MVHADRTAGAKLLERVARFARSAMVGGAATVTDFVALVLLVEVAGLTPRAANVPALVAGALVQFLGNRHFTFRAAGGAWGRQAARFAVAEAVTLALNAGAFWALTGAGVPYVLARPVGTFLIFVGVSYPLWQRVFKPAPA
jgi:putative flippase GtrA